MGTIQSTESTTAHAFEPADLDYLLKRAVDPDLAWREGFRSADEAEVHRLTGNVTATGGGLVQAYRMPLPPPWDNSFKRYVRVQLHERGPDGKGKAIVPSGPVPPYFTSACTTSAMTPIMICESPVKALSLMTASYPEVIGLGGVSAGFFTKGSGAKTLQPHLEPYFAPGRPVYVCLDSNRETNPAVAMAEARIARALLDRGCKVRVVAVPRTDDGQATTS